MLNMSNNGHENADGKPSQKAIKWILVDSAIIGLLCKNSTDTKYHLLLRDVVTPEDVLTGYTLTVVYTLRTTV